jgi:CRISPR/Cas system type I-B associated protein Csh2 (Cas7 group RAMP superfamily)
MVVVSIMAFGTPARADVPTEIRALEERFVAAFKAKDVDAIMKQTVWKHWFSAAKWAEEVFSGW